jgi:uncharacterized membrane protein
MGLPRTARIVFIALICFNGVLAPVFAVAGNWGQAVFTFLLFILGIWALRRYDEHQRRIQELDDPDADLPPGEEDPD